MSSIQKNLIAEAIRHYGVISPCRGKTTWSDSFTCEQDRIILWFNTQDNSTHIVCVAISGIETK